MKNWTEALPELSRFPLASNRLKERVIGEPDDTGKLVQMRLEGLTARCFQHELDHMNGIRFIDNVKPMTLQMARKKQQKIMKQAIRNQKKK